MTDRLPLYKFAAEALNDFFDENDISTSDFANQEQIADKNGIAQDEFVFEFEGRTYTISFINGQWDNHVYRGSDPMQYYWFEFEKDDQYQIAITGYYSSWDGGEWDSDGFVVTKSVPVTDFYLQPV